MLGGGSCYRGAVQGLVSEIIEFPRGGPPLPERASGRWGSLAFHHLGRAALPFGTSADGKRLLVARGQQLLVLDRDEGLPRKLLRTTFSVTSALFPAPGICVMAAHGPTGPVYAWGLEDDDVSLVTELGARIEASAISRDGSRLAFALAGREVASMAWPPAGPGVRSTRGSAEFVSMAISDDGARVGVLARTWEIHTQFDREGEGRYLDVFDAHSGDAVLSRVYPSAEGREACFSAGGDEVLVRRGAEVDAYDAATGDPRGSSPVPPGRFDDRSLGALAPPAARPLAAVRKAAISPDGNLVATGDLVVDLKAGTIDDLPAGRGMCQTAGFSPGSDLILRLGGRSPAEAFALPGLEGEPFAVELPGSTRKGVVAPNGTWAAFAEAPPRHRAPASLRIFVVDIPGLTLRSTLEFPGSRIRYLVSSPDSSWLLAEGEPDSLVSRWDLGELGDLAAPVSPAVHLQELGFIHLAAGGAGLLCSHRQSAGLTLRDPVSAEAKKLFFADVCRVSAVALSADGRWLAGGAGRSIRLMDLRAGVEAPPFEGHIGAIHWLGFSPDSRSLLSASADGTLVRWDLG